MIKVYFKEKAEKNVGKTLLNLLKNVLNTSKNCKKKVLEVVVLWFKLWFSVSKHIKFLLNHKPQFGFVPTCVVDCLKYVWSYKILEY